MQRNGHIVLFNQYSQDLSGWFENEVLDKPFLEKFIPESDQLQLYDIFQEMFDGRLESKL